jgi:hypothetical protein
MVEIFTVDPESMDCAAAGPGKVIRASAGITDCSAIRPADRNSRALTDVQ